MIVPLGAPLSLLKNRFGLGVSAHVKSATGEFSAMNAYTGCARDVSIVDEWCCGYVKGIALDPLGWQPLESGWDRLKELVAAHEDADARHQAFVDLIAPAARNIDAYWLARRAPAGETIGDPRPPIHKAPIPGRNDPCPCGSGKKFKHCHGAPESLH